MLSVIRCLLICTYISLTSYCVRFVPATCSPLSYDTCEEFIRQFDRLYAGRDVGLYPLTNPMVKGNRVDAQTELELVDVQFPIGYTFQQSEITGVIDRSLSGTRSHGDQLRPVHDKIFSLVNPTTGKALTIPATFQPNRYALRENNVILVIGRPGDTWRSVAVRRTAECQERCNAMLRDCAFFIYDINRHRCKFHSASFAPGQQSRLHRRAQFTPDGYQPQGGNSLNPQPGSQPGSQPGWRGCGCVNALRAQEALAEEVEPAAAGQQPRLHRRLQFYDSACDSDAWEPERSWGGTVCLDESQCNSGNVDHDRCGLFNIYFKVNPGSEFITTYLSQQDYEPGNTDQ